MTKLHSIFAGAVSVLLAAVTLVSSAYASTEPGRVPRTEPTFAASGEARFLRSGEPSSESGVLSLIAGGDYQVLGEVLYSAAGIGTSDIESSAALLEEADTAELAKELRGLLDLTQLITDDALRAQIVSLAAGYGYSFTEAELDAILRVIRSFETLSVDELQAKLEQMRSGVLAVEEIREGVSSLGDRLQAFIQKIIELIGRILGRDVSTLLHA